MIVKCYFTYFHDQIFAENGHVPKTCPHFSIFGTRKMDMGKNSGFGHLIKIKLFSWLPQAGRFKRVRNKMIKYNFKIENILGVPLRVGSASLATFVSKQHSVASILSCAASPRCGRASLAVGFPLLSLTHCPNYDFFDFPDTQDCNKSNQSFHHKNQSADK